MATRPNIQSPPIQCPAPGGADVVSLATNSVLADCSDQVLGDFEKLNAKPAGEINAFQAANDEITASSISAATSSAEQSLPKERPFWENSSMPAALVSFVVHILLLLLLAIFTMVERIGQSGNIDFVATQSSVEDQGEEPVTELLLASGATPPPPSLIDQVTSSTTSSASNQSQAFVEILSMDTSPRNKTSQSQSLVSQLENAISDMSSATFAATGVDGRSLEKREDLARARGGTLESEEAVERALEWLAAHQLPSGAWSLVHNEGKCDGRCRNAGDNGRYEPAATGLALLTFLGAGYTHKSGKYQKAVHAGIYFLLQIIEETTATGSYMYQSERGMYNHGIATFALCEAYQLTEDKELKRAAQKAINFIVTAQNQAGGWGYLPQQPGDLTITGWQVMALKSAYAAGLEVPPTTIQRIDPFLDSQQAPSGVFYGYGKPGKSPTCSSIGVLLRIFRTWSHTDPRALELADFLNKTGRSNGDVYFNYYATLLLFHIGGPPWEQWNPKMRDHLVKTQSNEGHESGSWFFENEYGRVGGRLYTTCMAAMTLEVYYRFSPLYQQADKDFEL